MELLANLAAYPTAVYTVIVGIALCYWVLVIVGAADLDSLDAAAGGLEAADGAMDGALEGAADGALEGAGEGVADTADAAGFLSFLKIRGIPTTVSLSAMAWWSWVLSYFGVEAFRAITGAEAAGWAVGSAILAGAGIAGVAMGNVLLRPVARFLDKRRPSSGPNTLVGSVALVTTGRVDETFGQARIEARGSSIVLNVRSSSSEPLAKGDPVLVIDYDRNRDVYLVEPAPALLQARSST